MPLLELRQVDFSYGDVQVLSGVSMAVDEGEIVALVGANGAGKTTTLRCISGLVRPLRGHIALAGERLDKVANHQIVSLGVVHVPEGRQIFPGMTVLENLTMGAYNPRAWPLRARSLDEVFAMFPILRERRDQLAGTLSGGEQQMLALGRGLMARPRVLMMDEPSLGLAPRKVVEIFTAIREIRKRQRVSMLLVEQNARMALQIADRGYVLETGRIVLSGTGADLLENPHVRRAYLGL